MRITGIHFIAMSLSLAGCSNVSTEDANLQPDADVVPDPQPTSDTCDKMDILFVIDNSGSMEDEQQNLADNFGGFVDVLDTFVNDSGDPIDYRVAVTTTGVSKSWESDTGLGFKFPDSQVGDDGRLVQNESCGMTRPWLERGDGNVRDGFACAANVGLDGPFNEMQLEALNLALTERVADGQNGGFVRDDALLAVVFLTDENDCSRTDDDFTLGVTEDICDSPSPVTDYVAIVDQAKGGSGRWATAVIAGIEPESCESELGRASESTRLIEFADAVGQNGIKSSICQGDLSGALADALATFDAACSSFPPIE